MGRSTCWHLHGDTRLRCGTVRTFFLTIIAYPIIHLFFTIMAPGASNPIRRADRGRKIPPAAWQLSNFFTTIFPVPWWKNRSSCRVFAGWNWRDTFLLLADSLQSKGTGRPAYNITSNSLGSWWPKRNKWECVSFFGWMDAKTTVQRECKIFSDRTGVGALATNWGTNLGKCLGTVSEDTIRFVLCKCWFKGKLFQW